MRKVMVRAHELARQMEGNYQARLALGLRMAWAERKTWEEQWTSKGKARMGREIAGRLRAAAKEAGLTGREVDAYIDSILIGATNYLNLMWHDNHYTLRQAVPQALKSLVEHKKGEYKETLSRIAKAY